MAGGRIVGDARSLADPDVLAIAERNGCAPRFCGHRPMTMRTEVLTPSFSPTADAPAKTWGTPECNDAVYSRRILVES